MMIDPIPSEIINWSILNEIISMDEDDPEFSKGLIIQFLDQAQTTFKEMDEQLQGGKDLNKLDNLGHFLKGSSAALGLQRIAWVCERIQNLGRKAERVFPSTLELLKTLPSNIDLDEVDIEPLGRNESRTVHNNNNNNNDDDDEGGDSDELYLDLIGRALEQARFEFTLARRELSKYYKEEL